jgi:hypothetical protein
MFRIGLLFVSELAENLCRLILGAARPSGRRRDH